MAELFVLALSFPSVIFTVLLGVVLVYWSFVIVGVLHIGEGSEGAIEGATKGVLEGASKGMLEGATKGMLEGASKGVLEGATKGVLEGHLGGGHGHTELEADLGEGADLGDSAHTSALAALIGALRLRSVPATVVLSLLITFSWLVCVVSMQATTRLFGSPPGALWSLLAMIGAPIIALPLTSLLVRPLARFFVVRRAPTKTDFIGRTCVVRTGTVTAKFGEATLEDGGAGLVLRVRIDGQAVLGRGEHALIVDYDAEHETYLVEPLSDLLASPRR
jgi:Protein of unknown function (DUF1449)